MIENKSGRDEEFYFLNGTLGNLYRIYGEPKIAITYLNHCVAYATTVKGLVKETVSLIRIGEAYKYDEQYELALELFERAFANCRNEEAAFYKDFVLQHKGKCLMEMSRLDEALECFEKALELRITKDNTLLIDSTLKTIGFCRLL